LGVPHLIIVVIGTFVGYLTFYSCSTISVYSNKDDADNCRTQGPAIFLNIWADIVGFLLQLILIWVSWILLPCSKLKGRPKFRY
jgi:hypothetical protein